MGTAREGQTASGDTGRVCFVLSLPSWLLPAHGSFRSRRAVDLLTLLTRQGVEVYAVPHELIFVGPGPVVRELHPDRALCAALLESGEELHRLARLCRAAPVDHEQPI